MFTKPRVACNLGGIQERTLDSEGDQKSKWTTGPRRRCQESHRAAVSTVQPPLQGTCGDPVGPHPRGQSRQEWSRDVCARTHARVHPYTCSRVRPWRASGPRGGQEQPSPQRRLRFCAETRSPLAFSDQPSLFFKRCDLHRARPWHTAGSSQVREPDPAEAGGDPPTTPPRVNTPWHHRWKGASSWVLWGGTQTRLRCDRTADTPRSTGRV